MKYGELAEVSLSMVAVIVLAIPEARSPAMRLMLVLLVMAVTLPGTWQAYRAGTLGMTLRQVYQASGARRRGSPLGLIAPIAGVAAIVAASL